MPKIAFTLAALVALAACNTVEGFGQDVENTGEAIEEEAE
ncbi:entericidin A/B family lipoprotein [Roseovarius aquimarinus]|uniref:Entericidin A/B family lipoprotein n=1 Tax=Roseovarius aquimarinus TaxID=1229156 RepID=A0ABW7I2X1_9RHOB